MTKKLTSRLNEKPITEVNNGITIKSRDYDFSSPESKERMKNVHYKQKKIIQSTYYSMSDLQKIHFP
jgi:hypothetical protein